MSEAGVGIYEGGAMHPLFPRGRSSGTLRLAADGLHFTTDAGVSQTMPLAGLQLAAGGASDRLIFFTHAERPEWSFFTDQRAILEHPALASRRPLVVQAARARGTRRRGWYALGVVALLLGCLATALYLARHVFVRVAANQIPVAVEQTLGGMAFEQLKIGASFVDDADLMSNLEALVVPLKTALPEPQFDFTLYLKEDESINAFALPGGTIVVHSGLLLAAKTPEEVAGVLAHEIAHVTLRHGLRNLIAGASRWAVLQAILGDIAGLSTTVLAGGELLIRQKYSRDFEREADAAGWDYLLAAGINPAGLASFFATLRAQEQGDDAGDAERPLRKVDLLSILQTHPPTGERLADMEARLANLPAQEWRPIPLDFPAFQARLRARLAPPEAPTASPTPASPAPPEDATP